MEFCFNVWTVEEMWDPDRRYVLSPDDFSLLNPNTRTLPTFRTERDAEMTKRIYRRVPVLVREGDPDGNPWGVSFMAMFHMANDSHLFHAEPGDGRVPLCEAKMVHHFTHRWATYDGDEARETTEDELRDPGFVVNPRWWVDALEVEARLAGRWDRDWLLGWRDIARNTDYRTVIASAIPRVADGDTFLLAFPTAAAEPGILLANLASFALDYAARQKIGGTHMKYHVFQQLPVVPPSRYDVIAAWDDSARIAGWLISRVVELVYTAWDMEPFARDHGYDGPPFCWDPDRRELLRAELDAAFFHLYGLERDDVDYVMDTFWVVRDRDVKAHGEYRTKRLILEIYDELAEAIATGRSYQTRLDPPPADPRVAHPPRKETPEASRA
jgi:hypothetical protein